MKRQKLSLTAMMTLFPDDAAAERWFIDARWPDGVTCPHCEKRNVASIQTKRPYMMWRCRPCNRTFSAKTKSLMHSSNLGFRAWILAMYLVTTNLKGIASTKLASDLNIKQSSAWHMIHRIRDAYRTGTLPLPGPVEVDETYIGGFEQNKHESKKLKQGGGAVGKQPIVGVKSRTSGQVAATLVNTVSAITLQRTVHQNVEPGSMVYTDQNAGYVKLARQGYRHASVHHGMKQFVHGMAHTNGIESFWSLLKRGYYGTFHQISKKHLQRYVNEFAGRHNHRSLDTMMQMRGIAHGFDGKMLRYRDLVS